MTSYCVKPKSTQVNRNRKIKHKDITDYCVVPGCRQVYRKSTRNTVFFTVPSNKQMLKKWQDVIPGQIVLKQGQQICSKHFRKNDITRITDMNHVGTRKTPHIRSMLSKDAIPYFFPDETTFYGMCMKNKSDPPCNEEIKRNCLYDELTLNPHETQGRNKAANISDHIENSRHQIALNGDSERSKLTPRLSSIDMSDSESNSSDINHNLSISDLREGIQNDLKEYVRCRQDLEQTLDHNLDLQTNYNMPKFSFHKLFKGTISIQIPQRWYKIIPDTVDKFVVFANFVLRSDKLDQMLVSYKSICIGEDRIAKCSILDKSLKKFPSECITSSQQLESIITKFDKLLVCTGVILGKEFAYVYSPLCYLDKQGHWRHVTCSLITVRGCETCLACCAVLQILSYVKNKKKPGPKPKVKT